MQMLQIHFNNLLATCGKKCGHVFAAVRVRLCSRGEALSIALVVEQVNEISVAFERLADV